MAFAHTSSSARHRLGYGIVLAGMLLMMASASAPSPFYPVLQKEFGFSAAVMTGIFAVYAISLLCTLLTAGSVSDHLGRRPVLSAGFALLGVSAFVFWHAASVDGLIIARILQGVACGLLISTLSAATVDLEPEDRPGQAAVFNSVLPLIGLAAGSLAAGFTMDFGVAPKSEVFAGLVFLSGLFAFAVWLAPETAPRHEGLLSALRPRLGLPPRSRSAFWRGAPAIFAGWATGGLYLSLGAPIVASIFGVSDFLVQGLVITLLSGAGAAACFVARHYPARSVLLYGTAALTIGTVLTIGGIFLQSLPLYLAALLVAGTGFGTCFYGTMRTLVPLAAPDERSELFASIFTLSYIAFSVPTVIAGVLLPHAGLLKTAVGYGAVIATMSAIAGLWRKFGSRD